MVWLIGLFLLRVGYVDAAFNLGGEGVEGVIPEPVEPGTDLSQTVRVDLVDTPRPVRPIGDQAGLLEDLQMLRDGRPADRKAVGQLAHGERPARKALKHLTSGRIGKRGKCVSHGLP
jgi:hypothetical protein